MPWRDGRESLEVVETRGAIMTPEDIDKAILAPRQQMEALGFRRIGIGGPMNSKVWIWVRKLGSPASGWPVVVHIAIQKRGMGRMGVDRWDVFMEIKNQIIGKNCEAVEIYPAEDRLRNRANMYHLWGFADPDFRLPFGLQNHVVT
jgi:hypothetical protein